MLVIILLGLPTLFACFLTIGSGVAKNCSLNNQKKIASTKTLNICIIIRYIDSFLNNIPIIFFYNQPLWVLSSFRQDFVREFAQSRKLEKKTTIIFY